MSNKVTYAELIEALSQKAGFSKQKSEAFSKALISRVIKELEETGKASITNFGSFKVKEVAERQGQNPQTGEPITIPAHNRVAFTPYKALKEDVNAEFSHLETELIGDNSEEASDSPEEEKEPYSLEKDKSTKFQFDKEPEQKEEPEEVFETVDESSDDPFDFDSHDQDEPEPEPEPQTEAESETESEEESESTPSNFDEPAEAEEEQNEEIEEQEKEVDQDEEGEPEPAEEKPKSEEPAKTEESEESNMVLILTIAAIFAVAMVSVWWFFLRTENMTAPVTQTPVVEESQSPATTGQNMTGNNTADEQQAGQTEEMESADTPQDMNNEPSKAEQTAASTTDSGESVETYRVKQDEWYWVIARKIYGNSQFWPLIYQENFTVDTHPDSLKNDQMLKVPVLEGTAQNPTKADYSKLAEASQMVSEAYNKFGNTDKAEEYARFAKKWQNLGR